MTDRLAWPAVADATAAVLVVLVVAGVGGPVRVLVALWFLLVCTGMSIVPALGIREPRTELLLGVAASIVIDTLVATALAATGALTLATGLIALLAVCLAGTALNIVGPAPKRRWWR